MQAFLEHKSAENGFFLDASRFQDSVLGNTRDPPSSALLNVAYLWGAQMSSSEGLVAYMPTLLSLSLRAISESLASSHPHKVLHGIQAEVLLAYYFLHNARILEAKYHTSAAVSLALVSGLGKIRTADKSRDQVPVILPPPKDHLEEGERIHAFWTVLTLNNGLAAADGSPSNISYTAPGARIDTPWPLDLELYSEARLSSPR